MREIKFRAWDSLNKIMIKSDDSYSWIDFLGNYWTEPHKLFDTPNQEIKLATTPPALMQFTGLHDKNGKEIYEGDIISFRNTKYEVVYRLGAFGIISRGLEPFATIRGISIIDGMINKIEVIGNVHQKPELLK